MTHSRVTGKARTKLARRGLLALCDQALWSLGFAAVTFYLAVALTPADFAFFAVCTSIAFIGVACARAGGVDSFIVSGARTAHRSTSSIIYLGSTSVVAASVAAVAVSTGPTPLRVTLAVAAVLFVVQDGARYTQVTAGRLDVALRYSLIYAGASSGLLAGRFVPSINDQTQYALLLFILVQLAMSGRVLADALNGSAGRARPPRHYAGRMAAEALYVVLAAQLVLLLLPFFGRDEDVSGLRLAYAMAFAPAGLILQGLAPHVLRVAARHRANGKQTLRLMLAWAVASAALLATSGVAFVLVSEVITSDNLAAARRFLVPIGATLVGGAALTVALMLLRLSGRPRAAHRLTLALVTAELVPQVLTLVFAGVDGYLAVLPPLGAAKAAAGAALFMWMLRTSQAQRVDGQHAPV